ncbi:MAG: hypothetical protein GY861_21160 [bacterium]|nr:hypothetical protein [bacterium]
MDYVKSVEIKSFEGKYNVEVVFPSRHSNIFIKGGHLPNDINAFLLDFIYKTVINGRRFDEKLARSVVIKYYNGKTSMFRFNMGINKKTENRDLRMFTVLRESKGQYVYKLSFLEGHCAGDLLHRLLSAGSENVSLSGKTIPMGLWTYSYLAALHTYVTIGDELSIKTVRNRIESCNAVLQENSNISVGFSKYGKVVVLNGSVPVSTVGTMNQSYTQKLSMIAHALDSYDNGNRIVIYNEFTKVSIKDFFVIESVIPEDMQVIAHVIGTEEEAAKCGLGTVSILFEEI